VFETATTFDTWLRTLASFVVDNPPMLTICALLKAEHLGARSVINSRCPYAGDIIVRSIAAATKPRGGGRKE
jgi:hypothetical protein